MKAEFPIKPSVRPHCYLCGRIEPEVKLTKDHVPPQNLFAIDLPAGLPWVPCCEECHAPLSMTDEAMYLWLSMAMNASEVGKRLSMEKAIPRIVSDDKLRKNVIKYISPSRLYPFCDMGASDIHMDQSRAIPYIKRLTYGWLYLNRPDYDYFPDTLSVFNKSFYSAGELRRVLQYMKIGNKVFEVWGDIADNGKQGVCCFRFFESAYFTCFFSKDESLSQKKPARYVEHPSLPKLLRWG